MKKLSLILAACGAVFAQDPVTVPLSNPSQPVTVKAHVLWGTITVNGGGKPGQVTVEMASSGWKREREPKDMPAGMKRLDMGSAGLEVTEDHNVVTIGADRNYGAGNLTIRVPTNASLQLHSVNGSKLEVTGVNGEIEVENTNGSIVLKDVSGNVVASSSNGSITANLDKIADGKPMSFTSMNGRIDVTLPASTKAKLRMKTQNGAIYSDFDVKMEPDSSKPTVEDARDKNGKYRIRMDRSVYGTINGGGPEYRFETMNGTILIHKK